MVYEQHKPTRPWIQDALLMLVVILIAAHVLAMVIFLSTHRSNFKQIPPFLSLITLCSFDFTSGVLDLQISHPETAAA